MVFRNRLFVIASLLIFTLLCFKLAANWTVARQRNVLTIFFLLIAMMLHAVVKGSPSASSEVLFKVASVVRWVSLVIGVVVFFKIR